MNKQKRLLEIAKIQKSFEDVPADQKYQERIRWQGQIQLMSVYNIPLRYLIYNKYNGRILSRTKSLERYGGYIDPETPEGKKKIEELLWESKKDRNETTKNDIKVKGQLKVGIVTKDGVIIDGNRRAMLLNELKEEYFLAVILPVAHDDDPFEIQKLETEYQMGEDKKLDYNPIEKYLKAKELYEKLIEGESHDEAINKIAGWMGEKDSKVNEYLNVLKTIDDYLAYLEYEGVYAMADTPNDGKEDLFIKLTSWIKSFYGKNSNKAFDGYNDMDVSLLKTLSFDYIRAKIGKSYDGKDFRDIADGYKDSHFFGNKEIWHSFLKNHQDNIEPIINKINEDEPVQKDTQDIVAHLSRRDTKFKNAAIELLKKNIDEHRTNLRYNKSKKEPLKLVEDAKKALDAIDTNHNAAKKSDVMRAIQDLDKKAREILVTKSPEETLSIIIDMLNEVKDNEFVGECDKDVLIERATRINKISFEIKKKLGR